MKRAMLSFAMISIFVLGGCIAKGPLFTRAVVPEDSRSVLYVYYGANKIVLDNGDYKIKIDGKTIGEICTNAYCWTYIEPGIHEFYTDYPLNLFMPMPEVKFDFEVDTKKEYFYCVELSRSATQMNVYEVPQEQALPILKSYRLKSN